MDCKHPPQRSLWADMVGKKAVLAPNLEVIDCQVRPVFGNFLEAFHVLCPSKVTEIVPHDDRRVIQYPVAVSVSDLAHEDSSVVVRQNSLSAGSNEYVPGDARQS